MSALPHHLTRLALARAVRLIVHAFMVPAFKPLQVPGQTWRTSMDKPADAAVPGWMWI